MWYIYQLLYGFFFIVLNYVEIIASFPFGTESSGQSFHGAVHFDGRKESVLHRGSIPKFHPVVGTDETDGCPNVAFLLITARNKDTPAGIQRKHLRVSQKLTEKHGFTSVPTIDPLTQMGHFGLPDGERIDHQTLLEGITFEHKLGVRFRKLAAEF